MSLTLTIRGLCGLILRPKGCDVAMPPGHHNGHRPVLFAPVDRIQTNRQLTTWTPDFVGYDMNGRQLAGWKLDNKHVRFETDSQGRPQWTDDRAQAIDLARFHPDATALSRGDIRKAGCAVFELADGTLQAAARGTVHEPWFVTHQGQTDQRDVLVALDWEGTGSSYTLVDHCTGARIVLKLADANGQPLKVEMSLTSVMPDPENAAAHFGHYYELISGVQSADRVTISKADWPVFDCVPDAVLPDGP